MIAAAGGNFGAQVQQRIHQGLADTFGSTRDHNHFIFIVIHLQRLEYKPKIRRSFSVVGLKAIPSSLLNRDFGRPGTKVSCRRFKKPSVITLCRGFKGSRHLSSGKSNPFFLYFSIYIEIIVGNMKKSLIIGAVLGMAVQTGAQSESADEKNITISKSRREFNFIKGNTANPVQIKEIKHPHLHLQQLS
jgi:hypothetical protein